MEKDREHLHQMYEILGKMPRPMTQNCDFSEDLFDKKGHILNNKSCEYTTIKDVLMENFEFEETDAQETGEFLKLIFEYDPKKRISARECLNHQWLNIT
jgi:serine/threonine-protein kinase SRPK3